MKEQMLKIAKDLEQGAITETEAQNLLLGLFGVSDSLIGRKLIYKGKEYTIIDKHDTSDFVLLDDENMTMVGLHWKDVGLVD